jgi:zinc protease
MRAPVVFSSIWYKVGSSYEPAGVTGISHALEHMMFRGTEKYGPGKLSEIVNSNGGEQNAMTSDDFTVYYQILPADKLELSFDIESDRMTHLTLSQDAFDKEIQVVMEERRLRIEDNPQSLTLERFNAIAYINNPYSHPTAGWMSDLKQMTVDDLRAWYHEWYVPNNAVIIVVGDIKPNEIFSLAKKYFGSIHAQTLTPMKKLEEVPALGVRSINVHIPAQLAFIMMGYNTPSLTENLQSNDPYTLLVLSYLLSGGDSSRLNHDLVRGQQIAANTSADYSIYNLYSNLFTISVTPTNSASVSQLQQALQKQVENLQNDLVSPEELGRAKALIIAQHTYDQDSLSNQAINLGVAEVTGAGWRAEEDFVSRVENVNAQQIRSVAQRYLVNDNLTIGVLNPIPTFNPPAASGVTHENQTTIH